MAYDYRNQQCVPDQEAPSIPEMCAGVTPQDLVGNQALQALCTINAGEQRDRDQTGLLDGLFGDQRQVEGRDVGQGTDGLFGSFNSMVRAMDRAEASVELRDRFDVVPDDFVGPRLPNQVTESEYSQIVNTYSDIRTGNSNFRFDNSGLTGDAATNFQQNALNDLATMMQTPSGRGLITETAYGRHADGSDHTFTIRGINNPGGARAVPGSQTHASDGVGTNSTVEYTPGQPIVDASAPDHYGNIRSDMVLYHEMVHARHHRLGSRDDATLDNTTAAHANDVGTRGWEYQAMGLGSHANDPYTENKYRAERRAMGEDQRHWDRYNP